MLQGKLTKLAVQIGKAGRWAGCEGGHAGGPPAGPCAELGFCGLICKLVAYGRWPLRPTLLHRSSECESLCSRCSVSTEKSGADGLAVGAHGLCACPAKAVRPQASHGPSSGPCLPVCETGIRRGPSFTAAVRTAGDDAECLAQAWCLERRQGLQGLESAVQALFRGQWEPWKRMEQGGQGCIWTLSTPAAGPGKD